MTSQIRREPGNAARAVTLARRSEYVQEIQELAGPDCTVDVQPFDRVAADRWRLVVCVDAADGFSLALRLNTDSHDNPRHIFLTTDEPSHGVFLPGSFQGVWSAGLVPAAATLNRLRRERRQAELDAPKGWKRPEFVWTGQRVRDTGSGRFGNIAVITPDAYGVVVTWNGTGDLSYVSPTRLTPAGPR